MPWSDSSLEQAMSQIAQTGHKSHVQVSDDIFGIVDAAAGHHIK